MEHWTPPLRSVTPFAAGALGRLAFVAGTLLLLWAAIGGVLGWWG
jgi:hypothetical protein